MDIASAFEAQYGAQGRRYFVDTVFDSWSGDPSVNALRQLAMPTAFECLVKE